MSSKDFLNVKATYELNKVVEIKNKLHSDDLIYRTDNRKKDKTYDFQKFKIRRSFGREIYINDLSLDEAFELQIRLKKDIDISTESTKSKQSFKKEKKYQPLEMQLYILMECKTFLMFLKVEYFQNKNKEKDL